MAAALEVGGRSLCVMCGKDNKATFRCGGCLQEFCFNHLTDHRQQLSKQLDEIEVARDLFRQTLTHHTQSPDKHPLIQQINDWERNSIKKIQETAEKARQTLLQCTNEHSKQIGVDLNKLTDQLRESRKENDFLETDLRQWKEELNRLTKELNQPSNVHLQQESTSLINKISVYVSTPVIHIPTIPVNAKWTQNGISVVGRNGFDNTFNRLINPCGLSVTDDKTIYVADAGNHRIVEWKIGATSGRTVAGDNGTGSQANQLNNPLGVIIDKENDFLIICDTDNRRVMRWSRQNSAHGEILISNVYCYGLTMDNDGYLYVPDYCEHEVRRWKIGDTHGTVVAGGNGQGNRLDQLNCPTYIFVDQDHSIYVSDTNNHRIMKWMKNAKEGIVVAGGQGSDNGLHQLNNPYGVAVDQMDTVYVVDHSNHRVMRWLKGATQGSVVVGGNGSGNGANQLSGPVNLSFDRQKNIYVTDQYNNRVQKFDIESN